MRDELDTLAFVAGTLAVVTGFALVSIPAALIFAGLIVCAAAVLGGRIR